MRKDSALKKPQISPALVLFVLSPAIGELLSGSSPPLEFFNPFAFIFMASLYGSGAIVVRELRMRWKKDFRSILLFGAAYGILEEGLLVKSFFDPKWVDLGILGSFGRWAEVNWVWTEELIIYHAVFSIAIPIALLELAYPERRDERWVGKRLFAGLIAVLVAVMAIGFLFLTGYRPPALQYLLAIAAMVVFGYLAYKLPIRKEREFVEGKKKTKTVYFIGLAGSTLFFLLFFAGPYLIGDPIILMVLGLILVFGCARAVKRFDLRSPQGDLNRLALVAGALSFLIFLAFMEELGGASHGTPSGMSFAGLGAIAGLLLLRSKVKKREA